MSYLEVNMEKLLIWRYGMPPYDFWLQNEALITKIIKAHKLAPIDQSYFMKDNTFVAAEAGLQKKGAKKKVEAKKLWPRPFPGRMRIPHVHLKEEIYLLKDRQWREFTKEIVSVFQERLAQANNVSFEQVMKLSEAIESL